MLAYPIPEAETLLESKLDAAQSSLANCEEDLDFLREQITVSVVNSRYRAGANDAADHGSRDRSSVQLGCCAAEKRKGRRYCWC